MQIPDSAPNVESGSSIPATPPAAAPVADFDEAAYLAENPDVRAAIAAGHVASGRAHFDTWGRQEGRQPGRRAAGGEPAIPDTGRPVPAEEAPQSDLAGELYRHFLDASGRTRQIHKWHHYFDAYERHFARFRGTPVTVLEIGVFRGGSLELWRSYFGPAARIVGLDVDPACAAFSGPGIEVFTGNQADPKFLRSVLAEIGPPQVVIDDGGHTMNQMIASFEAIYPAMPAPGAYLVEDTHTCFWGSEYSDRADGITFLDYAAERCRDLHGWTRARDAFGRLGTPPSSRPPDEAPPVSDICRRTGSIHFYDSIVVFERSDRAEPWHEVR